MRRLILILLCVVALLYPSSSRCEAAGLTITKVPGNCGYVETASVSYFRGTMYVAGWLKPHSWKSSKIYVKVDLKDATGKVVATKTGYAYAAGRPQNIAQLGIFYVVSFDASQLGNVAAVEVRYIN